MNQANSFAVLAKAKKLYSFISVEGSGPEGSIYSACESCKKHQGPSKSYRKSGSGSGGTSCSAPMQRHMVTKNATYSVPCEERTKPNHPEHLEEDGEGGRAKDSLCLQQPLLIPSTGLNINRWNIHQLQSSFLFFQLFSSSRLPAPSTPNTLSSGFCLAF